MGGVGGELLLGIEQALQVGEHLVKGAGQPGKLIVPGGDVHPAGQVGGLVDGRRGRGDLVQGAEGPAGDEVAPQGGQHDEQRHDDQGDEHQVGEQLGVFRRLQDAPDPNAPLPAQGDPEIQHVVAGGAHLHRPGQAVLEWLAGGEGYGHLPGQEGFALAVDQGVHPVVIEAEVLPQRQGAVLRRTHLPQVAPNRLVQLVHGGLGGYRAADQDQKDQQQGGHEDHEQGVPDGDLDLDARPLHGRPPFPSPGSRMTQPIPLTVWMSF